MLEMGESGEDGAPGGEVEASGKLDVVLSPESRKLVLAAVRRHHFDRSYFDSGEGELTKIKVGPEVFRYNSTFSLR